MVMSSVCMLRRSTIYMRVREVEFFNLEFGVFSTVSNFQKNLKERSMMMMMVMVMIMVFSCTNAETVRISNSLPRRDTSGKIMDAHDSKMFLKDGVYHW